MEQIIMFATMIVTIICGYIANKVPWFNSKLIPIQNILIGMAVAIIYYVSSGDFSYAVGMSGLMSTGIYSFTDNIEDIFVESKEESQG